MQPVTEGSVQIDDFRRRVRNAKQRRRYGPRHRALRKELARDVERGSYPCARCGEVIDSSEPWDLDHDDSNPRLYLGPAHRRCNRAAANESNTSREW
jgi:hypothetical protein